MSFWDDLGDIVDDAFGGLGNVVGLIASGGAMLLAGPGYAIPVFVGASVATNALVKQRKMSDGERAFASEVFGNTLPPNDKITLTNMSGLGGRAFVVPGKNMFGEVIMNIGPAYDSPTTYVNNAYPLPGQMFIHELTHVWQVQYAKFGLGFLCECLVTQFRYSVLNDDVYNKTNLGNGMAVGRNWRDYGPEEQATIADLYFQFRHSQAGFGGSLFLADGETRLRPYVVRNLQAPNPNADYLAEIPPSQLAKLVTPLAGDWWEVTYADGGARRAWFYANGTAKFGPTLNQMMVTAPNGMTTAQVVRAMTPVTPGYLAASAVNLSTATLFRSVMTPSPAVERVPTPKPLKTVNSGSGRWTYRPGKVVVDWGAVGGGTEEWTVPIDEKNATGRRITGGTTFKAVKHQSTSTVVVK